MPFSSFWQFSTFQGRELVAGEGSRQKKYQAEAEDVDARVRLDGPQGRVSQDLFEFLRLGTTAVLRRCVKTVSRGTRRQAQRAKRGLTLGARL